MTDLQPLLKQLTVPDEKPRFFETLRARVQEHDRASARRWQRATVALAALAVTAITAAAVLAATWGGGSTVDRTVSCAVPSNVLVTANAKVATNPAGLWLSEPSQVPSKPSFVVGTQTFLFTVGTTQKGYSLDGTLCRRAASRVPLAPSGLPLGGVYRRGYYTIFSGDCAFEGRALLHVRVRLDDKGNPESAKLAVWRRARPKPQPLAFVDWSPGLTRTYLSSRCKQ